LSKFNLQLNENFSFFGPSLIGLSLFGYIHERICAACKSSDIFANKSVLLMGDPSQLAPIMDKPIYGQPDPLKPLEVAGARAYASFTKASLSWTW